MSDGLHQPAFGEDLNAPAKERDAQIAANENERVWTEAAREANVGIERDTGVSPCFVNCGEPACQKLGCVKVYNARHRETDDGGVGYGTF